jgi:predicted N-formylglutamate amidohydrolase
MDVIVTCEHAVKHVPEAYRELFLDQEALLDSHRGWDPGAHELARRFVSEFGNHLHSGDTTRLLVDLNRSPGHETQFSEFTADLPKEEKEEILNRYYRPYRRRVREDLQARLPFNAPVVHLAVHTFTPELDGEVRSADVGLMYDPSRDAEKAIALAWRKAILAEDKELRVRRNYPYKGTADAFVQMLRQELPEDHYIGLQVEVNQAFPLAGGDAWVRLQNLLVETLSTSLRSLTSVTD